VITTAPKAKPKPSV
jgi:hypothetical protein